MWNSIKHFFRSESSGTGVDAAIGMALYAVLVVVMMWVIRVCSST